MLRPLLVFLMASTASFVAAPSESAEDVPVIVAMPNGVLYDACGYYAHSLSVSPPSGYDKWELSLRLFGPNGRQVASSTEDYGGPIEQQAFYLCESPNLPGAYRIEGEGQACNAVDDCIALTVVPDTFSMRLPKTKTLMKVKPRSPAKNGWVRFIIETRQEQAAGYLPRSYTQVALQARLDGRWVLVRRSIYGTDFRGRVVLHYHLRYDHLRVRAKTLPSPAYLRSKTPALSVQAR